MLISGTTMTKACLFGVAVAALLALAPAARAEYKLESELKMPGVKVDWDYLLFDAAARRLYINRVTSGVTVYTPDDKKIVGTIDKAVGSHEVAIAGDKGYTSNDDGTSTVFDTKTLAVTGTVKVGDDNDSNTYDPATKSVMFMNADAGNATFVRAADGKVLGKVALGSKGAEFPSPDGKGKIFIAIRDNDEVLVVDSKAMKKLALYKTAPCKLPTASGFDPATNRVFLGCRGAEGETVFAAMDASNGKVVASLPIGRGVDALAFDPDSKRIFVSAGISGNITVIQQKSADEYAVAETITTKPGARTVAVDPKTKKLFTVTAQLQPGTRKTYLPDSFVLLTYAP